MGLRAYATFNLIIRATKLWIAPYSEYQQSLYDLILKMRSEGHTFTKIANYLNEHGYRTTRGKNFKNAHAHSILKKKTIRNQRLEREVSEIIENFNVILQNQIL